MGIWEIIIGSAVLLFSIIMIIVIILQEGHESSLGTVTGGADSFLSRGKARTADALFARITKYCAIVFFLLVVLLNALSYFGLTGASSKENSTEGQTSETSVTEISYGSDETSSAGDAQVSNEASAQAEPQVSSEASAQAESQVSNPTGDVSSESQTSSDASAQASAE